MTPNPTPARRSSPARAAAHPARRHPSSLRGLASVLALAIAAGAVCAAPVRAAPGAAPLAEPSPPRSAGWSARLGDEVVAGLLRASVSYARMVADVTYGALTVDAERGGVMLRDLSVTVPGPAACRVTVGQLALPPVAFLPAERGGGHLVASDVAVGTNCFGANSAMIAGLIGRDSITLSDLSVEVQNVTGSGATQLAIAATSPDLARIEGSASFDYLALTAPKLLEQLRREASTDPDSTDPDSAATDMPDPDMPDPDSDPDRADTDPDASGDVQAQTGTADGDSAPSSADMGLRGTLRAAHLTLEDHGLLGRLKPILPPQATDPDEVRAALGPDTETDAAVAAIQSAFADAAARFMVDGGRITAEIRPEQPISFDSTAWDSPEAALVAVQPRFANAGPTPSARLLAAPVGTAASDAKTLGLALARGTGIPQNRRAAIATLTPLANDPEVALALAELRMADDPMAAYGQALSAAAAGAPGAPAALDAMEAQLSTEQILRAQPPADVALPDTAFASVAALRDAARDAEAGTGAPRSYGRALRLALPAAAAGDVSAQALIDRLDARFGADRGWRVLRDTVSDIAMADWQRMNLPATLSAR